MKRSPTSKTVVSFDSSRDYSIIGEAFRFAAVMPTTIAQIYEELCVTIPCDLKEFAAEHEEQPVDSLFVENQKRMMANKHLQALDRVLEEDAEEERAKSDRVAALKKRKKSVEGIISTLLKTLPNPFILSKEMLSAVSHCPYRCRFIFACFLERKKKDSRRSLLFSKDGEGGKKSRLSVPETPDYKLNRKRQRDQCLDDTSSDSVNGEVVVQTPLAKMRRSAKIGELISIKII